MSSILNKLKVRSYRTMSSILHKFKVRSYRTMSSIRAVYPERNDSSIMTLSILMRWVVTQTNRMIPSMTRYAAATRSRRCPRESEPLACLKFESKQRVIFPLATVAMAY